MLIKPFASILTKEKELATMSFLGTVEDNKDPKHLHRVKVHAAPYENMTTEELPWACPKGGISGNSSSNSSFNVPEVGSQVRIFFPNQDLTAPHYEGAEYNETNKTTFFDEDYPNTYGYKDSKGNFLKVNKEKETIHLQHSSTSNVKVSPEGSVQVTLSNGSYLLLDNGNSFDLNIKGCRIWGGGGDISIEAKNSITMSTNQFVVKSNQTENRSLCGVSGVFWAFGHTVTVTNGIITAIKGIVDSSPEVAPKVKVDISDGGEEG